MKKINELNGSIRLKLTDEEAKEICNHKKGVECCAFLSKIHNGFQCLRMLEPDNEQVFTRLEAGTVKAKGEGCWPGCPWKS
jgi:hypothetical protein